MSTTVLALYFRTQAERCNRLSRNCMDLGTARDLRLMAEEYLAEAGRIEHAERFNAPAATASRNGETSQDNLSHQTRAEARMQQQTQQRQPRSDSKSH
jgi:hypothetical protein